MGGVSRCVCGCTRRGVFHDFFFFLGSVRTVPSVSVSVSKYTAGAPTKVSLTPLLRARRVVPAAASAAPAPGRTQPEAARPVTPPTAAGWSLHRPAAAATRQRAHAPRLGHPSLGAAGWQAPPRPPAAPPRACRATTLTSAPPAAHLCPPRRCLARVPPGTPPPDVVATVAAAASALGMKHVIHL